MGHKETKTVDDGPFKEEGKDCRLGVVEDVEEALGCARREYRLLQS